MWQDAAWRQLLPLVRVELRYLGFAEMQKVGNVGQSIAEKKGSFSSISLAVQNLSVSILLPQFVLSRLWGFVRYLPTIQLISSHLKNTYE